LGVKPLHYASDGERLAFASEPRALLELPWVDRSPDHTAIADYLGTLCVPAPKTAYAGIRRLRPGELLEFEPGRVRTREWWDVEPATAVSDGAAADATERVRALLFEAVEAHMVADVPVGLFLSGGVDSSSVGAMMRVATELPVRAYSIGFDVPEHSESDQAARVARFLGLEHHARTVGVDAVRDALDRTAAIHDEPFADGSSLPTHRVSELAASDGKVVLSGDGGDEVFAGYRWYQEWLRGNRFDAVPRAARRAVSGAISVLPRIDRLARLADLGAEPLERYARLMELFPVERKLAVLGPAVRASLDGYDHLAHLRRYWREDLDPITRVQYLDLKTYLPDDILTKVDRASMAVSLEVRPPLLDHVLVEAVFALPASVRVPEGRPKGLLKDAMAGRVPAEALERPKKGFSAPWNAWLPELRTLAAEELRDGAAVQAGVLAPDPMERIGGPHRQGARAWALLVLERWCRANL
jgi:asparagine synthase (glutamine-hydrolysing)